MGIWPHRLRDVIVILLVARALVGRSTLIVGLDACTRAAAPFANPRIIVGWAYSESSYRRGREPSVNNDKIVIAVPGSSCSGNYRRGGKKGGAKR